MGLKLVYEGPTGKEKYLEHINQFSMDHEWDTERIDKEAQEEALQLIQDLERVKKLDRERVDKLLAIAREYLSQARKPRTIVVKAHWCRSYSPEYWSLFQRTNDGRVRRVWEEVVPTLQSCAASADTTLKELLINIRARVRFCLVDTWTKERDVHLNRQKKVKYQVRAWDVEESQFGEQNWAFVTLPIVETQRGGLWVGVWTYGPLVDEARIASRERTMWDAGKRRKKEKDKLQETLLKAREEGLVAKARRISPKKCPYQGGNKIDNLCRTAWMQARYHVSIAK